LDFKDHLVSADIEGAQLRAVIEEIKKEMQGVWFKIWLIRSKTSLDEKVLVEFENLPIRKGMRRIFSDMNHGLVFDKHNNLLGITLLGKPTKLRRRIGKKRVVPRRRSGRYVRRK
jgi:hypothetical protein